MQSPGKALGVVYSSGDLGDVGRHAVAAALEYPPTVISSIRVMGSDVSTLEQPNWKCGCPKNHVITQEDRSRLQLIRVDVTTENMKTHIEGLDTIISCLGNRKPFHDDMVAKVGTENLVQAMVQQKVKRLVMISSVGIWDDWPPMEWSFEGKRLAGFFRTICWQNYQDLTGAELAVRKAADSSHIPSFLIVRSVATPEQASPEGTWFIQNKKGDDAVGVTIAKLDCARFMVREAVEPTISRKAVVLGGRPSAPGAPCQHEMVIFL